MPDYRTHPFVAERGDVDFQKQPDLLRRNRRKWIWLAGILGLWPLAWQFLGRNDQTIYWAGTVSNSHQLVQNDCQKCHREWGQTFRTNFMSPKELRVVEANTCQTCHLEDTRDHNAQMVISQAQGCFDCHAEHRHKLSLNDVADVYCVACHRDLKIAAEGMVDSSPSFVTQIRSFADHPEFQIRRELDVQGLEMLEGQKDHLALRLAKPPTFSGGDSETSWEWKDRANFHFNHQKHLSQAGVGIPPNHPANLDRKRKGQEASPTKQLHCADCHEMERQGEYALPINYERHCAGLPRTQFSRGTQRSGIERNRPRAIAARNAGDHSRDLARPIDNIHLQPSRTPEPKAGRAQP